MFLHFFIHRVFVVGVIIVVVTVPDFIVVVVAVLDFIVVFVFVTELVFNFYFCCSIAPVFFSLSLFAVFVAVLGRGLNVPQRLLEYQKNPWQLAKDFSVACIHTSIEVGRVGKLLLLLCCCLYL